MILPLNTKGARKIKVQTVYPEEKSQDNYVDCVELIKEEVARKPELQNLVKLIKEGEAIGPWSYKSGIIF